MREVCFLVDVDGRVIWSDTNDQVGYIPDSRERWEAIWSNRDRLSVIAHSHPYGPFGFSETDLTTFDAIMLALGRHNSTIFAVVAPEGTIVTRRGSVLPDDVRRLPSYLEPTWARPLRIRSGMVEADADDRERERLENLVFRLEGELSNARELNRLAKGVLADHVGITERAAWPALVDALRDGCVKTR